MIFDFDTYCLFEKSVKGIKKVLKGTMSRSDRHMMKKLLRKNVVFFSFRKKDGSLRKAVGTLIPSYLPALKGGSPKPEHQMVYYDLEKEHWRSFRSYSFIKIIWVKSKDDYLGKIDREREKEEKEEKLRKKKEEKEKLRKEKEKHVHSHKPEDDEDDDEKDEEHVEKEEKEEKKKSSEHDEDDEDKD